MGKTSKNALFIARKVGYLQKALLTDRAVANSLCRHPSSVISDITTSYLPFWDKTRLWVIARPMTGFAETFLHYIMEVGAGGGSTTPDTNAEAQSPYLSSKVSCL